MTLSRPCSSAQTSRDGRGGVCSSEHSLLPLPLVLSMTAASDGRQVEAVGAGEPCGVPALRTAVFLLAPKGTAASVALKRNKVPLQVPHSAKCVKIPDERWTERAHPVLLLLLLLLRRCFRTSTSSTASKRGRTRCGKMPRWCKLNVQMCHLLPPARPEDGHKWHLRT